MLGARGSGLAACFLWAWDSGLGRTDLRRRLEILVACDDRLAAHLSILDAVERNPTDRHWVVAKLIVAEEGELRWHVGGEVDSVELITARSAAEATVPPLL